MVAVAGGVVALAGLGAALLVPRSPSAAPELRVGWNIARETVRLVRDAHGNRPVWLSTLGITWFWIIGATLLAAFPTLARDDLHADGHVVTLMLAFFSIGIGAGSVACARLLHGEVSARYVPFAAIGISLFTFDFARAGSTAGTLADVHAMLSHFAGWRVLLDLTLLAFCGGIYSVPLYALLQERAPVSHRSRIIAANNVVNAAGMVGAAAGRRQALSAAGLSAPWILVIAAGANLLVAGWIVRILPQETLRALFRWLFSTFHGVDPARARQHADRRAHRRRRQPPELPRRLLPRRLPAGHADLSPSTSGMARHLVGAPVPRRRAQLPVDLANPFGTRAMIRAVQAGETLVIFPEGRITKTGALMKVYEGAGMVADKRRRHAGAGAHRRAAVQPFLPPARQAAPPLVSRACR